MGNFQTIIGLFGEATTSIEDPEERQSALEKAIAKLFQAYGQKLYGWSVVHFQLEEDEGLDVLYKTLLAVGKVIAKNTFLSEEHFKNWLFKIHKNNVLQLLRVKKAAEKRTAEGSFEAWEAEALESGISREEMESYKPVIAKLEGVNFFETSLHRKQLMAAMEKALLSLRDDDRELLLLRMTGYEYPEIAEMLGLPDKQLKVKFLRAKAKVEKKTLEIFKKNGNEK